MQKSTYLIIGGGIAGTGAAEAIRTGDQEAKIIIVSKEPYPLYSRIMLSKPNFFLGKIPLESIWLKKDAWYQDNNITLLKGVTAIELLPREKTVKLDNGEAIQYEKLLLATGGHARIWDVKGAGLSGIFYLHNLNQSMALMKALPKARRVVVVGSGLVSFEVCDLLRERGLEVTVVMLEKYFGQPLLDEQTGRLVEQAFEKINVKIIREICVQEVLGEKSVEKALLSNGALLPCDLIMANIGMVYHLEWLKQAGLDINRGILANQYLETSLPDIWTAGDCAEYQDITLGDRLQLLNWTHAQKQGCVAGANMVASRLNKEKTPFRLISCYTSFSAGLTLTFIGDTRPQTQQNVILQGDPSKASYARIFTRQGVVVGAMLVNRTSEIMKIRKMIEESKMIG